MNLLGHPLLGRLWHCGNKHLNASDQQAGQEVRVYLAFDSTATTTDRGEVKGVFSFSVPLDLCTISPPSENYLTLIYLLSL